MNPSDLVAHTVRLAEKGRLRDGGAGALDLVALAGDSGTLFERDGVGFACRGQALVLERPGLTEVVAALNQIECHDELRLPGTGPIAIGALPFDQSAPGTLVIPRTAIGIDEQGAAWCTTVRPRKDARQAGLDESAGSAGLDESAPPWPPDRFTLSSPCPHERWCELVARAVSAVESGELTKVVLAREVLVEANRDFRASDILGRLRALYPSCTIFSVGGFVGASPELLVRRRGRMIRSHPHAGTVARSGDPETDDALVAGLMGSTKQRNEHRVVVEAVAGTLQPLCAKLNVPPLPSIVLLRNVSHLATMIEGELADPHKLLSALDLATRLHPTPAVAGTPTAAALSLIAEIEGMDRGRYAGPVGWVDSRGDGDWVVGIRSATLDGATARLVAGVGVVAGSDPREELAETQLKLQALLAAVVRP